MNSIILAKSKLPIDFLDELNVEFSTKMQEKILNGICEKRFTTLRINKLKISEQEVSNILNENGIEFEVLDLNGTSAYIIKNKNEKDLQKLNIYQEGKIYLQSISSMIPPIVLNPMPDEKVLDLTAAPGSKTTQMASMMENKGEILANEIDKIRFERLKYNLNMQGIIIAEAINEDGIKIGNQYPERFDKVLIDAPCSGEGRFILSEKATYEKWSMKMVRELSKLQKNYWKVLQKLVKKVEKLCILHVH